MERQVVITGDGSSTIHLPAWEEQYHSKHGAIQEAYHVFIKHGLHFFSSERIEDPISILEIGFGTGLNAFITLLEAEKLEVTINYVGVEGYPVDLNEISQLNYPEKLKVSNQNKVFKVLHKIGWEIEQQVSPYFLLKKEQKFFHQIEDIDKFHIIYFDAFGARVQPELWTEKIFKQMYIALKNDGVLVTYSAKGSVRRAMQEVGFKVQKLPGPPGKREMLRAVKSK